ncbi:hypothetical protein BDP27DRAFT_1322828 [Rhodocollybia butyracea]|uniref:RhoGAP-domain-containing protein n=1 Tax=Rhodocollybia butyracea TaxID=206335 RepID=A0A9P5PRX7_9AGAR|nr:hypothetical protein BDP27DRAFT_1322828 [Rhodocollybia butyracea]
MIAAMSPQQQQYSMPDDLEERLCPGCKLSVVSEEGGLVVAFGQCFFHVNCFKCAKCSDKVTADTNLLLLSDGSPICANCSYACNVCKKPILDEAIMTGDDAYHAHCFKCKVCKNRIDELVFAKTSQGIYCMDCHNERMIKIRKHTQKKAERERERQAAQAAAFSELGIGGGGSLSTSARDRDKRAREREKDRELQTTRSTEFNSVFHPPPRTSSVDSSSQRPFPLKNNSLPVALDERSVIPSLSVPSNGSLTVTSVRDKRRSINPGLVIKPPITTSRASSPTQSPVRRSPTPPVNAPSPSPARDSFSSRPTSSTSNAYPQRTRTSSAVSSSSTAGLNGDDTTVTMRPSPSPRRPTASSSPHPNSPTPKPERFSGSSLSPRPHSTASRSPSRADLPRSVESATDDDDDDEDLYRTTPRRSMTNSSLIDAYRGADIEDTHQRNFSVESVPPPMPPPKDSRPKPPAPLSSLTRRISSSGPGPVTAMSDPPSLTPDSRPPFSLPSPKSHASEVSPVHSPGPSPMSRNMSTDQGDISDSETTENSAEDKELLDAEQHAEENGEQTANRATATYIAPALPPIRFSLNTQDFSDMFSSVGGNINAFKNLDSVAEGQEKKLPDLESVPTTPPPSAASNQPNTMSYNQNGLQSMRGPDSPRPLPVPSLPSIHSIPSHNDSSTSVYTSANESVTVTGSAEGSAPTSEDGHSSNSDHHKKDKGGSSLLRKVSFGKRNKLDRSASSSKALKDKEKRAAAEAMPGTLKVGLAAPMARERAHSDPEVNGHSEDMPSFTTTITISPPSDGNIEDKESASSADLVLQRLQEVLTDATDRGAQQLKLDRGFVEAIVSAMATRKTEYAEARKQIDTMKRASQIDGLSVALTEYDRELKARRDAEAEVTRLRVLLSGQAVRLTALTGDSKRQELRQKIGLERDLSKLKVERDVTLAEVEELNAASSSGATSEPPANLGRTLTKRLDNLKSQYQRELLPLTQQREALTREVMELRAARDTILEETTVLNARNEDLAQLNAQYSRRVALAPSNSYGQETPSKNHSTTIMETPVRVESRNVQLQQQLTPQQLHQALVASFPAAEDPESRKIPRIEDTSTPTKGAAKVFGKWGSKKEVLASILQSGTEKGKAGHLEHSFQPLSLLRFTRCDHCGDKMWGSQLRCAGCNISVHTRCVNQVHSVCSPQAHNPAGAPSMFGGPRRVPVIVEKCIEAVETLAMDYEGIYRKTGGSGQSRAITQLFERGDYNAFDLRDSDRFNDICSVTSVLKTYLRSLPIPLLTYDLHETNRDPTLKNSSLTELVNKLPSEHYHTVKILMLHLNRICQRSEVNLMNARNLGVVFGPTLMRSRNPGAEFSDMAGKALTIEWLVESAPQIFSLKSTDF